MVKTLTKKEIAKLENGTELMIKWWNRKKFSYYTLQILHGIPWVVPTKVSHGLTVRPIPLDLIGLTINDVLKETIVVLSSRPFINSRHIVSKDLVR